MTIYMASTHPDYRGPIPASYLPRTGGAHRRNHRWGPVTKWIRVPNPRLGGR